MLQELGRELRRRGVTHVVMEASGVYTDPVYYALAELDFEEVMVINPSWRWLAGSARSAPPGRR